MLQNESQLQNITNHGSAWLTLQFACPIMVMTWAVAVGRVMLHAPCTCGRIVAKKKKKRRANPLQTFQIRFTV